MRAMPLLARIPLLILAGSLLLTVEPMGPSAAALPASGNQVGPVTYRMNSSIAAGLKVSVSPTSGPRGTSVTVRGKGYQPQEQVNVYYRTNRHLPNPTRILICTTTAGVDGKSTCTGVIPTSNAGRPGSHTIQAEGQTAGTTAQTTFTLT